ncbi:hypothetical protein HDV00_002190 [Rhizophlyctis rosea]|nr:hypothetical protein HDV00_002190 [Rhizophlyctis rosea]
MKLLALLTTVTTAQLAASLPTTGVSTGLIPGLFSTPPTLQVLQLAITLKIPIELTPYSGYCLEAGTDLNDATGTVAEAINPTAAVGDLIQRVSSDVNKIPKGTTVCVPITSGGVTGTGGSIPNIGPIVVFGGNAITLWSEKGCKGDEKLRNESPIGETVTISGGTNAQSLSIECFP